MDFDLLKMAGQIAGIGGLAIGALILVFRDVIAKNIFPNLSTHQAYLLLRLVLILVWSVAIIGIIAWTYITIEKQGVPRPVSPSDRPINDSDLSGQTEVVAWVNAAEEAQNKEIIHHDRPVPTDLVRARATFEGWWVESNFHDKQKIDPELLYKALNHTARLYRVEELQSETKPSANLWCDEAIRYFEQTQNRYLLVESLLDKAALYLELSQIEHTEPEEYRRIAEDGDALMARATSLASDDQKSRAYRIWSRFYYNLARPKSGDLSEKWDYDYLLLSYQKGQEAFDLQPEDIKNATQLARATYRVAVNSPQDVDANWTRNLRRAQQLLLNGWKKNEGELTTPTKRIPPLNILANITMETARREWESAPDRILASNAAIDKLTAVALPALREALALLPHTEWEKDYDFDFNYDLGRINAVITTILTEIGSQRAGEQFQEVLKNMGAARLRGSAIQNDAAFQSVETDPNLAKLPEAQRAQLRAIFRPGP